MSVALPHQRTDPRSAYKRAVDENPKGTPICVCPFGCGTEGHEPLEELGYCKHLIGFTNAKLPEGPVKSASTDHEVEVLEKDARRAVASRCVTGRRVKLQLGDVLVKITHSSRVYRECGLDHVEPKPPAASGKK